MTGLVTNRKEIGASLDQIRYAGVLEAVELVLGREPQILLQMVGPEVSEMFRRMVFRPRTKAGTKKIPVSGA
jgi:hypothetical protein